MASAPPAARPAARPHPSLVRATWAAGVTLSLVLIAALNPDAVQAYSANMMGTLRAPGEPAFIAGHRGDRADAPENTVAAFDAAIAHGLDFVETDVQLTSDGVAVIMHDETVDRTTDGTGAVADLTFAEVRALDAGSWFDPAFAGTRVPTLGEYLDVIRASKQKGLIELKGFWSVADVRSILDAIYTRGVQDRVVLASFHFGTIENAGTAAPAIPRVIIRRDLPADPVRLAAFYGAIAVMTTPWSLDQNPRAVKDMHDAGLGVLLYTLNSEKRWNVALRYGVDGIVTDTPSELDQWIAKTAPGT